MKENSNKNEFSIIFTADEINKMNLKKKSNYYIRKYKRLNNKNVNINKKLH